MESIFQIYLYICGIIIGLAILAGLLGLTLNLICYAYQSFVGFDIFKKFLRKYNEEMQIARRKNFTEEKMIDKLKKVLVSRKKR